MSDVSMKSDQDLRSVRQPVVHDSATKHVSGSARYIDDMPEPANLLHIAVGGSDVAHGVLKSLDLGTVLSAPGVVTVLTGDDIPGDNDIGPIIHDEPVFATSEIVFYGQPLFAVVATNRRLARQAVRLAKHDIEPLDAILDVDSALEADTTVLDDYALVKGQSDYGLSKATRKLSGSIRVGGQEHFYLEGQVSMVLPQEDGDMLVYCSTQHPSEVQHGISHVLGVPNHAVTVENRRMGGGFGGKETQGAQWAAIAALGALKTGQACKIRLDRDDDMVMTGKRHDFRVDYHAGYDNDGMIESVEIDYHARCGHSADLSGGICDRTLFHGDNCYYLPDVTLRSRRLKTNTVSNTAFRGFGGPQGMMGIETIVEAIARDLGIDSLDVRKRNLYGGDGRDVTPYHMTIEDNIAPEIIETLEESSDYRARREQIRSFNQTSKYLKKGLALTPVKFGISFTVMHLNQAGALVHVYNDGSVSLNHGGTEMGQGLYVKVAQVVADEFGIDLDRVRITATTTDKVPNTSPTAASSGSDLNAMAARNAAQAIANRLREFAAEIFQEKAANVTFANNVVQVGTNEISFNDLVNKAYFARVSLSSTGFYSTPKIHYDQEAARGRPFYYFSYGAACSEVVIDTLTGEMKVSRVDILHDVGHSLNPAIDLGQIEGGFVQGMGWLTTEELCWNDNGRLMTHAPSTYKIPTAFDVPEDFRIEIYRGTGNVEDTIYKSKAVGEPPLMLAISVFAAISDAISSIGGYRVMPPLNSPATPEEILKAVDAVREMAS